MRRVTLGFGAAALAGFLAGCSADDDQAIQDYIRTPQTTRSRVRAIEVEQAIRAFVAQNGRYPASLDELPPGSVRDLPPGQVYWYDPETGEVEVVDG